MIAKLLPDRIKQTKTFSLVAIGGCFVDVELCLIYSLSCIFDSVPSPKFIVYLIIKCPTSGPVITPVGQSR